MKRKIALILPAFAVLAHSVQGATNLLQVDFDNNGPASPGNTQSGWEAFSDAGDAASANKFQNYPGYTDLALGNISVTTSGFNFVRNYNNGGLTAPDFPGGDLDRVYNDLFLNNGAVGTAMTVTIGGLKAGTYQFTTHHLTDGSLATVMSTFNLDVQDADSAAFGQSVGLFSMGKGSTTTFFAPTAPVFTVTSNGTDPVAIRITTASIGNTGGQSQWVGINGLEIAAVPEPSTALLGGIGLLALLRRRR